MILVAVAVFYFKTTAFSQAGQLFDHIDNSSIKFNLVRQSPEFIDKNKVTTPKTLVRIKISALDSQIIRRMKPDDWIRELNNPKNDWAANLMLYAIYEKDAVQFKVIHIRDEWINTYKASDMEYWKKKLH